LIPDLFYQCHNKYLLMLKGELFVNNIT
jgi:hypothetical protein